MFKLFNAIFYPFWSKKFSSIYYIESSNLLKQITYKLLNLEAAGTQLGKAFPTEGSSLFPFNVFRKVHTQKDVLYSLCHLETTIKSFLIYFVINFFVKLHFSTHSKNSFFKLRKSFFNVHCRAKVIGHLFFVIYIKASNFCNTIQQITF